MYVRVMHGPDDADQRPLLNPSRGQIEAAIRALDGRLRTLLCIGPGFEGPWVGVGGGPDRYVVSGTLDNDQFFTLTEPDTDDLEVEVTCGAQAGFYPSRKVVDLTLALQAARVFAESGQLDPNLAWELEVPFRRNDSSPPHYEYFSDEE